VGSIPIARSTLEVTPGHAGLQDWGQNIDPMGKPWEIDAGGRRSWPHVFLHCPRVHTYGHTQQFPKIICVIPLLPRSENEGRWLDSDPELTLVNVGYRADQLRRESVSIFKCTGKGSKIDSEPLQPGPQYWQFVFHESALFTTEKNIAYAFTQHEFFTSISLGEPHYSPSLPGLRFGKVHRELRASRFEAAISRVARDPQLRTDCSDALALAL
jgi:hypothetical protein